MHIIVSYGTALTVTLFNRRSLEYVFPASCEPAAWWMWMQIRYGWDDTPHIHTTTTLISD